jgi:hypothetical protein
MFPFEGKRFQIRRCVLGARESRIEGRVFELRVSGPLSGTPCLGQVMIHTTGALVARHLSLLVRCHAPQCKHLYVLSSVGADSLSLILRIAVAFASPSLAYIRLPDTGQVWG